MIDDSTNLESESAAPSRQIKPSLRARLGFSLAQYNPFYFISAACMLAGILAVTNSLSWNSIPLPRLLLLITTLNVYEATLIGLALFLMSRRLVRDATMLLILEAFFLADATFLNAEIATVDTRLGLLINAGLFALAVVKIGIVLRYIGPAVSPRQALFVVIQLFVLFALPCWLRWVDTHQRTQVTAMTLYVGWWIAGLLPAVYTVLSPKHVDRELAGTAAAGHVNVYLALPWISVLGHLGIMHYVYGVGYFGAMAAPILLGLTCVLNRYTMRPAPRQLALHEGIAVLRLVLPVAALFVSANNPHVLCADFGNLTGHFWFTPLKAAVAGSYFTFVYCFAWAYANALVPAGLAMMATVVFGPTSYQVFHVVSWMSAKTSYGASAGWTRGVTMIKAIIPSTTGQWGVAGIAAAFAFLGVGAYVSLSKADPEGKGRQQM